LAASFEASHSHGHSHRVFILATYPKGKWKTNLNTLFSPSIPAQAHKGHWYWYWRLRAPLLTPRTPFAQHTSECQCFVLFKYAFCLSVVLCLHYLPIQLHRMAFICIAHLVFLSRPLLLVFW
jgi:hypothetical protein